MKKLKRNENITSNDSHVGHHSDTESGADDIIIVDNNYRDDQHTESVVEDQQCAVNDIEDRDDNFFDSVTDELIHPNLECKVSNAVLMILSFFLEHQLTWVALEDLLQLFSHVLGPNSHLPKTKYFFKKCFDVNDRAIFHFYCKNCDLYLGTYEDVHHMPNDESIESDKTQKYKFKKCANCEQVFSLNKMNDGKFYIQLSIKAQIEEKLKIDPNILNFNTNPNPNNSIGDIFDGDLYKSLKAKTANFKLLTLTLNTDGVRVFKSKAKSSLWPVQMILNEVPLQKRYKQGNIMLSGISFGKDPDFSVYLRPLVQELKKIDEDKIEVNFNGVNHKIALRVLLVSSDSPARCKVMKLKQYNGQFGCTYCLHPGETFGGSNMSKYPTSSKKYQLRTHAGTVKLMKEFLETGVGRLGITGVSPLLGLIDFDLIRGSIVDYMHAVLLGIVYLLLDLWFDSENHFEKYYVTPRGMESVNRNIKCILPPRYFSRQPRVIEERPYWKANELRNWLLYYAVPCLKDTLKEKYWLHFSLLSEAVFIFLQSEISAADFTKASSNLKAFVTQFESYYGKSNMVYNVHLLEHLPKCVTDCGPLWGYSNFNFESSNGFLVKNVKGTSDVEHQLAEKFLLNNALSDLKRKNMSADTVRYIDRSSNQRVKFFKKVGSITLFGKPRQHDLNTNEKSILKQTKALSYNKFYQHNEVYYSSKFKRSKKRKDTAVFLKDGTFGEISLIFEENESVYLILKKLQTSLVRGGPSHVNKILTEITDEYFKVRAEDVSEKCILIETSKESFISRFPNRIESD